MKKLLIILMLALFIPSVMAVTYPTWGLNLTAAGTFTGDNSIARAFNGVVYSNIDSICDTDYPVKEVTVQENIPEYDIVKVGSDLVVQNKDLDYMGTDSFTLSCFGWGVTITQDVTIEVKDILETTLYGDPIVIVGEDQYFSAYVENAVGEPIEGAAVNAHPSAGSCTTDVSGWCEVQKNMPALGHFSYYATSSKTGYLSDNDADSNFEFDVIEAVYEIQDLEVYSDSNFGVIEDEFYRGDKIYVSFRVYDTVNDLYVTRNDNLVQEATLENEFIYMLVVPPQGAADDVFHYTAELPLSMEPTDELIFGVGYDDPIQAFGMASARVTVKNNQPEITSQIGPLTVDGKGLIIDLSAYESDTEDSGNDLAWTFQDGSTEITDNQDPLFGSAIVGKTLQLVGSIIRNVMDLFLQLHDSDGGMAEQNVLVNVTGTGVPTFKVSIQADVTEGEAPLEVQFTAAPQFGDQPISYSWDFNGDGVEDSIVQNPSAVFNEGGSYTVKLTATDNSNMAATGQIEITVTSPPVDTGRDEPRELAPRDKLYVGRVGIPQQGVITPDTKSMSFTVNFRNTGDEKLKDLSIRASIPDLAMRARSVGPFDLRVGEELHERVRFETGGDMQSGYYLVHLTISSDDIYREANREVWVE